jgi:hypothetical protein
MNKKYVSMAIAVTMILVMTLSSIAPLNLTNLVHGTPIDTSHPDWYTTVNGALSSDTYALYPYEHTSVNYGFSKFGELIGISGGKDMTNQTNWVGMEYDGRDPFCPNDTVPMTSWINGWFIWISYTLTAEALITRKDRQLFAFALFSDGAAWGGDWQTVVNATVGLGGRQTNGVCTSDTLNIIYHGPRRFVAQSVTHVSDKEGSTTWPVCDVVITMIFDKDLKEVILLKDVVSKIDKTHLAGKMDVELSDREEYDLGPKKDAGGLAYQSFVHYYPGEGITKYNQYYESSNNLTREYQEGQAGHGTANGTYILKPPGGALIAPGFLKVYVGGVFVDPSLYTVDYSAKNVTFKSSTHWPKATDTVTFVYKYIWDYIGSPLSSYDIAQVISADEKYVAFCGFWPKCADWTVQGLIDGWESALYQTRTSDMATEPDQSPLIEGQWEFLLGKRGDEYRCVEVKGICNLHDADDVNIAPPYGSPPDFGVDNEIDMEAYYQLNYVFYPWDLMNALDGQAPLMNTGSMGIQAQAPLKTMRWVDKFTGDGVTSDFELRLSDMWPAQMLDGWPYVYNYTFVLRDRDNDWRQDWNAYDTSAERVLVNGVLMYPDHETDLGLVTSDYQLWWNNHLNTPTATLWARMSGLSTAETQQPPTRQGQWRYPTPC